MDDETDTGGAERAFEALRAEVAALRQAVEGQAAADYALTLGEIVKEQQAIGARLAAIESHPALAMTPEGYSERLSAAVDRMRRTSDRELRDAKEELGAAVRRVEHLAGKMHTRDEQRRWLARPQPVAS